MGRANSLPGGPSAAETALNLELACDMGKASAVPGGPGAPGCLPFVEDLPSDLRVAILRGAPRVAP